MESIKWLKRKYPNSFEDLNNYFDRFELENFKKSRMKLGRLTKDVSCGRKYKKGEIVQFRRSNPINDYNHPWVEIVLKCPVGFTESGYHSFLVSEDCFTEINN